MFFIHVYSLLVAVVGRKLLLLGDRRCDLLLKILVGVAVTNRSAVSFMPTLAFGMRSTEYDRLSIP
jgi:hypothetical protein